MEELDLNTSPHRRRNILTGEWILVSPHRMKRPWQGQIENSRDLRRESYNPSCYLCPGNTRANGETNPKYTKTFIFTNDFSSLIPTTHGTECAYHDLLAAAPESGVCRVVCFSPRHDLSLAEMETEDIRDVLDEWVKEYEELGSMPEINHVQIFENKGEIMGCSNPHPHGQVWAQHSIPTEPAKEIFQMQKHMHDRQSCLLCDYLTLELKERTRVVFANNDISVIVPFWAVWPFETIVVPHRHVSSIGELTEGERNSFADIIKRLTTRYDNLFQISFPYSAGLHQSPTDGHIHPEYHTHMHFYPPLLRSANIRKFMVGYEMLADPQRDTTPETSASQLRGISEVHYLKK
ncbi:MAG: UDP-glucose--hexose-1-phosphate uridylyltransferase [Bacteroidota bacterium]